MAFGTELQGRTSHEALLNLQDFEIRMLENVKKCIAYRVKVDREYATMLTSLVATANKVDLTEFNTPVCQVWASITRDTETLGRLFRDSADQLCSKTLEKFLQIISEKKTVRRLYADERSRMDAELNRLQDDSNRLAVEYERSLGRLQQNRTKFEESCKKVKAGAKYEELKSKYVKSETKVHNLHNDYVVALHEVNMYRSHYISVMLPALLEFQQTIQENLIQQCKDALDEYARLTDCTSAEHQKVQEKIIASIQSINPAAEYKDFVSKHRTEPIKLTKSEFQKETLDNFTCSLKSSEIVIDELTIAAMKQRLINSSDQLDKCRLRIESKKQELSEVESQMAQFEQNSSTSAKYFALKRCAQNLKREILEVQCSEEKLIATVKLIGDPIEQLGSTRPVSGLIDVTEANHQEDEIDQDAPHSSVAANQLSQTVTNIRSTLSKIRPFKKPHPNLIPSFTGGGRGDTTSSSGSDEMATFHSVTSANGDITSASVLANKRMDKVGAEKTSDGYQQYNFTSETHPEMTLCPGRPLEEEEWYHGVLPRDEVQRLLVDDGDYLVRASKNKKTGETQYVLSVMWSTHKHFIIQENEGGYRFEGDTYSSVQELIIRQHQSLQPVTRKSEAILKKPIYRPDWELRNDDIELNEKIGSGQFGEVYRGVFKVTGALVAIKTCRETLCEDVKRKFLQEGRILKQYDHPNIVKFIGIAAQRHPVMIVMEFVSGGALLTFLRKQGSKQTLKTLVQICEDAAAGMAYLESKNCLHRDLAARNCLVGANNTVKISDFGMSREEEEYVVSQGLKQIPIKWTAPEALNFGTYTSACDVWSYGILMWEVFSFGGTPYPGLTNSQARDKVDEGYRMSPPEGTPTDIFQLMTRCWEQDARERPRFSEIHQALQDIKSAIR